MPAAGRRIELDELGTTLRAPGSVSTSDTKKAMGAVDVFSLIVWLGILEISGRSLTEFTVRPKLRLVRPLLASVAVTVMVRDPDWFGAGIINNARLASVPPSRMFASGTRFVFDDRAVMLNAPLGVSRSVALKPTTSGVSSSVTWSWMIDSSGNALVAPATATVKARVMLPLRLWPSDTTTVITAEPRPLTAGVRVSVPFVPGLL